MIPIAGPHDQLPSLLWYWWHCHDGGGRFWQGWRRGWYRWWLMIVKGGFDLNGCDRCRLDIICPVAQYLRHNIDHGVMMTIYILWWSVCLMFYPHFPFYHQDEVWDVYCYLCMIGGVCLSVFFTFYPHFLEWCVFRAEHQRREARRWENPQMYPPKLY